jgi:hypothetical protein
LDPYVSGVLKKSPYVNKKVVKGNIVVILSSIIEKRGLNLIIPHSRAVKKNEIHEIMTTSEKNAAPGEVVNKVAYVGFFEVNEGGVILTGDDVYIEGKLIGKVIGFDDTHMPNHQNIVLYSLENKTGPELNINLEDKILFKMAESRKDT